jgi:transposase-like protein
MKERKQFTKEFKEGAVRLVTEQGRTRLGRGSESRHLAVDARRGGLKRRRPGGVGWVEGG